ncbi:DNA cytosine methyltransferase [Novosphingobium sp. B1]|uniref:DNA cytosine methyltransferase n=1 Tax=Novosphingobium sp. B1 TaxID=1938756 RepID=UPI0009D8C280|nr:DNA cytosine methyltransferase [Novosphingobium sp. B1]SMC68617.1 C-5 cytosine-specific DNA methylase [Novosphingobium sp. B1]
MPVAFAENSRAEIRLCGGDGQVSSQLTTGGGKPGQGQPCIAEPFTIMERGRKEGSNLEYRQDGTSNAILTPNGGRGGRGGRGGLGVGAIAAEWAVRRLTPTECERLQGFPDNWTKIAWRKKPDADCPDGPRYRSIGNSMAVNVMRFIGERIKEVDQIATQEVRAA